MPPRPSPVRPEPSRLPLEPSQLASLSVFARWPERATARELEDLADHMLGLHLSTRPAEDQERPVLSHWQLRRRRMRELALGAELALSAEPRRGLRRELRQLARRAAG